MTLETFFEKFDQFADAPNAVAKMRELVLQLAVTGKLVAQDKRDEPASSLLESAGAERTKLVTTRKIKARPAAPVELDEQPFDLPTSWTWARLSDVGYELGQKVPDKRFTYIDVGSIDSDKGCISDRVEKLESNEAPSRARKLVARGTVIYSTVRPYLLNIAVIDQDFDPEPIASTAFGILHPFAGINNRYLFYWLRSAPFTAYVQAGMKGMAYPAINDEKFYSGFIALPPLAEQKRIVAKVDELMALCGRLEAQQQEREKRHAALARASLSRFADAPIPANLNFLFHKSYTVPPADLRKSILTLAIQGLLVPRQTEDGKGSAVVNEYSLRGLPDSDHILDLELPEHWAITPFSNLARIRSGVTKGRNLAGRKLKAFPYLRVANVQRGYLALDVMKDIEIPFEELEKYRLESNDLLITEGGDWDKVGRTAIWREEICDCIHQNHVFRARLVSENLKPEWFMLYLNSPIGRRYFESAAKQTTNLASINATELRGCPVPIPPLAEQRRIVAKVDQLMALVDPLETQLAASRATANKLLEALVAELTTARRP